MGWLRKRKRNRRVGKEKKQRQKGEKRERERERETEGKIEIEKGRGRERERFFDDRAVERLSYPVGPSRLLGYLARAVCRSGARDESLR